MTYLRRVLLVLGFVAASLAAAGGPAAAPACASESAVVVIRDSRGVEREECVALPGPEVNGVELLRLAGVDVVTRDYGGTLGEAVCSLDDDGSPASDCPSASGHWHLWLYSQGAWKESIEGASSTEVEPGAVHGWTWTTTGSSSSPPPPTPDRICGNAELASTFPGDRAEARSVDRHGTGPVVPLVVGVGAVAAVVYAVRRRRQHP